MSSTPSEHSSLALTSDESSIFISFSSSTSSSAIWKYTFNQTTTQCFQMSVFSGGPRAFLLINDSDIYLTVDPVATTKFFQSLRISFGASPVVWSKYMDCPYSNWGIYYSEAAINNARGKIFTVTPATNGGISEGFFIVYNASSGDVLSSRYRFQCGQAPGIVVHNHNVYINLKWGPSYLQVYNDDTGNFDITVQAEIAVKLLAITMQPSGR